jgi:hypothetical protein
METLQPVDQPFSTAHAILAFSLHMAGIPFADPQIPCSNFYDEKILSNLGYKGMELEAGARAAFKAGKKGHLEFHFRQVPRLGPLLQAFREQQAEIENKESPPLAAAERSKEIIESVATGAMHKDEAILRLSYINLKMRREFLDLWHGREDLTLLRIPNPGTEEVIDQPADRGSITVRNPGFKIISLNASKETREALGL